MTESMQRGFERFLQQHLFLSAEMRLGLSLLTSSNKTELPLVLILLLRRGRGPWGLFVAS